MFESLKDLFARLAPPAADAPAQSADEVLQLAAAVLIAEVIGADADVEPSERDAMRRALHERFGLTPAQAAKLAALAEQRARETSNLYELTAHVNAQFGMPQKLRMLEMLWRAAYADAELEDPERHVVRRIADLMKVPQGASAGIRERVARESRGG